jgi:hypothetical protein
LFHERSSKVRLERLWIKDGNFPENSLLLRSKERRDGIEEHIGSSPAKEYCCLDETGRKEFLPGPMKAHASRLPPAPSSAVVVVLLIRRRNDECKVAAAPV